MVVVVATPALEERVLEAKRITGVSECIVETRWNTLYFVLEAALTRHKKMVAEKGRLEAAGLATDDDDAAMIITDSDLLQELEAAQPVLEAFAKATNRVQRDNACTWDAFIALQHLLDMCIGKTGAIPTLIAKVLAEKADRLLSGVTVLLAFLSPNVAPVGREHDGYMTLMQVLSDALPGVDRLTLLDYHHKRVPHEGALLMNDFVAVTETSLVFPVVRRLLAAAPTEAAVERVFSRMKFNCGHHRTTMTEEASIAQVLFNNSDKFINPRPAPAVTAGSATLASLPDAPIKRSTMQWIVDKGWKQFSLGGPQAPLVQDDEAALPPAAAAAAAVAAPAAAAAAAAVAAPATRARRAAPPVVDNDQLLDAVAADMAAAARLRRQRDDDDSSSDDEFPCHLCRKEHTGVSLKCQAESCVHRIGGKCMKRIISTGNAQWTCVGCVTQARRTARLQ
jgi:hypothetical protein